MNFVFYETTDADAAALATQLLKEGTTWQIDNKWSVRVDRTHHDPTFKHNHVLCRGNNVAVINQDGTPSHNSDLSKVPNWVLAWMNEKGLTEQYLLSEEFDEWERVPTSVLNDALHHESLVQKTIEHLNKTNTTGSS
jgi:hypothetical protein